MCVRIMQHNYYFYSVVVTVCAKRINGYQSSVVDGVRVQRHLGPIRSESWSQEKDTTRSKEFVCKGNV